LDIVFERDENIGVGTIWFSDFHHQKDWGKIEILSLTQMAPQEYHYLSFVFADGKLGLSSFGFL